MALSEDCLYSQVIDTGCCGDHGLLRIPILSIRDIRQQSCKNSFYPIRIKYSFGNFSIDFNGRYQTDHPHLVITYIVTDSKGTHEYQAGWQMKDVAYNQWKTAIEQLRNRHPPSERA